ncbi:MAG: 6,7-dimethyl-8-ribityllumazine synthase [Candidatus Andersenbacteria bacterium]
MNISLVVATFHRKLADDMIQAAKTKATELGWTIQDIIEVPGTYEIPLAAAVLLETKEPDALAVLGCIERGETLHGEVMGHVVHRALIDLQLKHRTPIGIGIIGPGATEEQAQVRKNGAAQGAVEAATALYDILVNF